MTSKAAKKIRGLLVFVAENDQGFTCKLHWIEKNSSPGPKGHVKKRGYILDYVLQGDERFYVFLNNVKISCFAVGRKLRLHLLSISVIQTTSSEV